jgi:hypothetical protein
MNYYRRAPRYHHYWVLFSTMPALRHKRGGSSELLSWVTKRTGCDLETARLAFESAKQAGYLVCISGRWTFDADNGFDRWNKRDKTPKEEPEETVKRRGPAKPKPMPEASPEEKASFFAGLKAMAEESAED